VVPGELEVVDGHWRAVRPLQVIAQGEGVGLAVGRDLGHLGGHGWLVFEFVPVKSEQAAHAVAAAPQQDARVAPGPRVGRPGEEGRVWGGVAGEAIDRVWPEAAWAACVGAAAACVGAAALACVGAALTCVAGAAAAAVGAALAWVGAGGVVA